MKLSANYSPALAALLRDKRAQLDCIKCPSWPDMVGEAACIGPVTVHFDLRAGADKLAASDWAPVEELLGRTDTPFVNVHLEPTAADFPGMALDTTDQADTRRVLDALRRDVWSVVEHFGPQRVIVENVPYAGPLGVFLRPATEPEVVSHIVEETGCGLLLDIAHARVSAHYQGVAEQAYMNLMPVHRLAELHFHGVHQVDGRLQDHLPATEHDWAALDWVLQSIRTGRWAQPWMLAFEYGGVGGFFGEHCDPAALAEQVPLLWARVKG